VPTSIRLSAAVEARLDQLAAQTGRSKAYYLREMIEKGLADLEDLYLAEQRLVEIRAGREATQSIEEVERELGLAD